MIYPSYTKGKSLIVLEFQHICPDNSASAVPRVRKTKREEDVGRGEKETSIMNSSSIKTKPLPKPTHLYQN